MPTSTREPGEVALVFDYLDLVVVDLVVVELEPLIPLVLAPVV